MDDKYLIAWMEEMNRNLALLVKLINATSEDMRIRQLQRESNRTSMKSGNTFTTMKNLK